ncbi:MAG: NAD-binding protein [Alistipes sp.]
MKNANIVKFIVILLLATIVFAIYGYISYYGYAIDDAIYKTLQLFTIGAENVPEKSLVINIARFLAPIVIIGGGLQLIYFVSQDGWKYLCLCIFKKHTIICGYGDTGKMIMSQLEQMGRKHIIVIDPLIEEPKVSFSKIFLNKNAANENVLQKEARIDKASEIIIVTGSDYINTLIYNISEKHNVHRSIVRIEQLNHPDNLNLTRDSNTLFFNLSEIIVEQFTQYDKQLIVVLGIGNIGKRVVERYKNNNDILVIEQSGVAIHMTKDIFNSSNIKYERADVKGLVESDIIRTLEKYDYYNYQRINLFVCLGGDWLGFRTAWDWLSWTKVKLNINLVGIDINKELLKDKGQNSISVYNVNEIIKNYCMQGRLLHND